MPLAYLVLHPQRHTVLTAGWSRPSRRGHKTKHKRRHSKRCALQVVDGSRWHAPPWANQLLFLCATPGSTLARLLHIPAAASTSTDLAIDDRDTARSSSGGGDPGGDQDLVCHRRQVVLSAAFLEPTLGLPGQHTGVLRQPVRGCERGAMAVEGNQTWEGLRLHIRARFDMAMVHAGQADEAPRSAQPLLERAAATSQCIPCPEDSARTLAHRRAAHPPTQGRCAIAQALQPRGCYICAVHSGLKVPDLGSQRLANGWVSYRGLLAEMQRLILAATSLAPPSQNIQQSVSAVPISCSFSTSFPLTHANRPPGSGAGSWQAAQAVGCPHTAPGGWRGAALGPPPPPPPGCSTPGRPRA